MNDTHVSNIVAAIDRLTEAVQNLGGDTTTIQTYSPPSYIDPTPEVGAEVETVAPTRSTVASPTIADLRDLAQALLDKGLIDGGGERTNRNDSELEGGALLDRGRDLGVEAYETTVGS